MPDYASQIAAIIGSAPADLVSYYSAGDFPAYPPSQINCLPFAEAKEYTQKMRGIPVVDRLGLWVLDDANDSNPFAFVSIGPCSGKIIHFSHDSEPEMKFSSLKTFLASMRDAGLRGLNIHAILKEPITLNLDRPIRDLAAEGGDDATFLLTLYLPISSELQSETMSALASYYDFFVREAFAGFLLKSTSIECEAIAERLAADQHPQVAHRGKAALAAIKRKKHEP